MKKYKNKEESDVTFRLAKYISCRPMRLMFWTKSNQMFILPFVQCSHPKNFVNVVLFVQNIFSWLPTFSQPIIINQQQHFLTFQFTLQSNYYNNNNLKYTFLIRSNFSLNPRLYIQSKSNCFEYRRTINFF